MYLTNSFSINMLPIQQFSEGADVLCRPISREDAAARCAWEEPTCAIGHDDLWNIVKDELILAEDLTSERRTIALAPDNEVLVAQYTGPRLPEGCTELPEHAHIRYWLVKACESREAVAARQQSSAEATLRVERDAALARIDVLEGALSQVRRENAELRDTVAHAGSFGPGNQPLPTRVEDKVAMMRHQEHSGDPDASYL